MCFVRKSMDFFFSQEELKWLDDIIPSGSSGKKKDDAEGGHRDELEDDCSDNDTKVSRLFSLKAC